MRLFTFLATVYGLTWLLGEHGSTLPAVVVVVSTATVFTLVLNRETNHDD